MVAPASSSKTKGALPADPPTNYYLLLLVKICLVVIILLWLAPLVTGDVSRHPPSGGNGRRQRNELRLRNLRLQCQNDGACALLVPEESLNCVNQCLSHDCYEQIFAQDPLEDGEIDVVRGQQFEDCVKEELRNLKKKAD